MWDFRNIHYRKPCFQYAHAICLTQQIFVGLCFVLAGMWFGYCLLPYPSIFPVVYCDCKYVQNEKNMTNVARASSLLVFLKALSTNFSSLDNCGAFAVHPKSSMPVGICCVKYRAYSTRLEYSAYITTCSCCPPITLCAACYVCWACQGCRALLGGHVWAPRTTSRWTCLNFIEVLQCIKGLFSLLACFFAGSSRLPSVCS